MDKFAEYFSIINHPYRYYALLVGLIFTGAVSGSVLAAWLLGCSADILANQN